MTTDNASSPPRSNAAPWIALAVAFGLYVFFQVFPLWATGGGNQNDFKHIYLGAYILGQGQNPYDAELLLEMAGLWRTEDPRFVSGVMPYVYLPFTGQIMQPLAWMEFATAAQVWMLLNQAMFLLALVIAAKAGGWRFSVSTVAIIGALVIWNYSVYRQNNAGQLNMVLALGYAVVALGLIRGWSARVVGSLAALLALFKLSPGILLVYFLLTRRWRHAAWMVGVGVGMGVVSATLAGWRTTLDFLPLLADMGYGKSTWAEYGQTFWRDSYNQSVNGFLHRTLVEWPDRSPWLSLGGGVANAITWLVSLSLIGILSTALLKRGAAAESSPDRIRAEMALVVMASLLLPSLMWDHYIAQGIVAMVLVWNIARDRRPSWWIPVMIVVGILWSLGVFFDLGRVHPGILFQPLFAIPGVADIITQSDTLGRMAGGVTLPGGHFAGPIWESLKLWPTLAFFGLCAWAVWATKNDEVPTTVKP